MFKALRNYFSEFKVLKVCPRDFWILTFVVNFLEIVAWFGFITILTLYLTQNVGFDDVWSQNLVAGFSLGISVIMFFSGFIIDSIGIKKALFISMAILIPTRFLIGITGPVENRYLDKNLEEDRALEMILEGDLHQSVFTRSEADFQRAQADVLDEAGLLASRGLTRAEILDDARLLRTSMQDLLRARVRAAREPLLPRVAAAFDLSEQRTRRILDDELEGRIKDSEGYKLLVVDQVAASPALRSRWWVDVHPGGERARAEVDLLAEAGVLEERGLTRQQLLHDPGLLRSELEAALRGAVEAGEPQLVAAAGALPLASDATIPAFLDAEVERWLADEEALERLVVRLVQASPTLSRAYWQRLDGEGELQRALADVLEEAGALQGATPELLADEERLRAEFEALVRTRITDASRPLLPELAPLMRVEEAELERLLASKLDRWLEDEERVEELVLLHVAASPGLSAAWRSDLDEGDDDVRGQIVGIVRVFPDLRAEFSIQSLLKWFVVLILIPIAFGEAVMVPAIYAAVRRYTNKRTSGTGFNCLYISTNIAAVIAGLSIDALRVPLGNESLFLFGAVLALLCTVAVAFLRSHIEVQDDGSVVETPPSPSEKREMPWTIFWEVVREKAFHRFFLFICLLLGVRLVFTHQFMVMPKYYTRVMGHDAPIGMLNAINPAIITIGLILFIPVIARFSVFRLILVGTTISAMSVMALCIPGKFFTGLGWSIENGYLALVLAQIVVFAVGEVIWSPRLQEYTVTIAPKGREGSYISFSVLPMFLAKPLNGLLSGQLLTHYCPDGVLDEIVAGTRPYTRGPEMMWVILAVIAIASPILIFLFRNVIKPDESQLTPDDEEGSGDGDDGGEGRSGDDDDTAAEDMKTEELPLPAVDPEEEDGVGTRADPIG